MTEFEHNIIDAMLYQNTPNPLVYERVDCKPGWVSEELSIADFPVTTFTQSKHLHGPHPILITAPTGSGKSTFVLDHLATDAREKKKKILILSNRLALTVQLRRDGYNVTGLPPLSVAELKREGIFGNMYIFTYQGISSILRYGINHGSWIERLNPLEFEYIVCDEAHFFCSDALFNAHTEEILSDILKNFWMCRRIYMTATPEEVKPIIAAYERMFLNARSKQAAQTPAYEKYLTLRIYEYLFPSDFSAVSLHFFDEWDSIESLIKKEIQGDKKDKWLLFVSSKSEGQIISSSIGKENSQYIDASNLGDSKILDQFLLMEKFQKKVLVATSVIYNGINFKDDSLTRVVVDFCDHTTLIQMLGRKRLSSQKRVHLYVKLPDAKHLDYYIKKNQKQLDFIHSLRAIGGYNSSMWESIDEDNRSLLYTRPVIQTIMTPQGPRTVTGPSVEVRYNYLAYLHLRQLIYFYQLIQTHSEFDEYVFPDMVCKWLGKQFTKGMIVSSNQSKQLRGKRKALCSKAIVEAVESKLGSQSQIELTKDEVEDFCNSLIQILKNNEFDVGKDVVRTESGRYNKNLNNIMVYFDLPYELINESLAVKTFRRK